VQQVKSRAYLKALSAKPREIKDIKYYYQQFATVSRDLIAKNLINKEIRCRLFIKNLPKNMITTLFRSQNLDLSENSSFSDFAKLKKHTIRITIAEQRLDEFTNDNRSQREKISELVNTLNRTVKQTKKSKIDKTGKNDIIKKLTKNMSKLILTAT
jgi:hypothetical protein